MAYPDGSATHIGVEYQCWFLALQISFSFFEPDRIIYPEAFITDVSIIDDIKVVENGVTTFYNVKHISPAKSMHWNISELVSNCVVKHIKQQYEVDRKAKIVFVSQSDCYLITEVFQRAVNAITVNDLDMVLASKRCIENWESAKEVFDYDDQTLLGLAQNVSMRCLPLYEIKKLIEHRFTTLGHHKNLANLFVAKSLECSGRKTRITKGLINGWLLECGINFK
ncbi:hypothetical protein ESY86_15720 [Subsaximicrobium wynnwilliamsii]|uniref:CD-NTase associated protein 4-like DNA endonuclease domain-containing protein n=1 Tax=Subsaximicrobium wynnwilliamsii TaxID=291179 RepID=A0A5C6ZEZ9_9FLAO|nr:dsDNA nuclease domain-containing protein [Subsaximicrobium wynnwilliamsii]TXD82113.1 hypothetical protein ESY87_15310 [Subsaximicrobium wynnwilliamsii]TXD87758.1 hypothetical protein ESY86_15720 [Subsaximicrobium wynnwilliamsii]TXE01569.1 hypothetical protein ESY88_15300 [Subsaximicrobium wynnwilliamsii]